MIKERTIDAGAISAVTALVVGAWWLAGQVQPSPLPPVAGPRPTVTVSPPKGRATEKPSGKPTERPSPKAVPVSQDDSRDGTATARTPASHSVGRKPKSPTKPPAATPPTTPPALPEDECSGAVIALRLPLGVLPDCVLSVGGR